MATKLSLDDIITRWSAKLVTYDGAISPTDALRGALEEALTGLAAHMDERELGRLDAMVVFKYEHRPTHASIEAAKANAYATAAEDIRALLAAPAPETNGGDRS